MRDGRRSSGSASRSTAGPCSSTTFCRRSAAAADRAPPSTGRRRAAEHGPLCRRSATVADHAPPSTGRRAQRGRRLPCPRLEQRCPGSSLSHEFLSLTLSLPLSLIPKIRLPCPRLEQRCPGSPLSHEFLSLSLSLPLSLIPQIRLPCPRLEQRFCVYMPTRCLTKFQISRNLLLVDLQAIKCVIY